jgi:hypothetical protein
MEGKRVGTRLLAFVAIALLGVVLSACAAAAIVGTFRGVLEVSGGANITGVQANLSVTTSTDVSGCKVWTVSGTFSANDPLHGAVSGSVSGVFEECTGDFTASFVVTNPAIELSYNLGGTLSGVTISGAWGETGADNTGRGGPFSISK